jgi:hypothetical protein
MAFQPKKDKKEILWKKEKEELIAELDEQKRNSGKLAKELEITQSELANQQQSSIPQYEIIARRPAIKRMAALAVGSLTVGIAGTLGVINYFSSLSQPTQSHQPSQLTTAIVQENPDDWPVRTNLNELRNALQKEGSRSQYFVPEYESMPPDDVLFTQSDFLNLTRDEVIRLYRDTVIFKGREQTRADWVMKQNPRLGLFTVDGQIYDITLVDYADYMTGKSPSALFGPIRNCALIMWALEPYDKTDKVLFRSHSGKLYSIIEDLKYDPRTI